MIYRSVLFINILLITSEAFGNILEQVVILGRHNLRTPLTSNLEEFTTHKWPTWDQPIGYLTPKGALMESYMGEYFSEWLKKEGLFQEDCPKETAYAYSNWPQRTKETARVFMESAFRGCNVTVHYKEDNYDPVFTPLILNTTSEFKTIAYEEIQKEMDKLDLKEPFSMLNKILNLNASEICKKGVICDLNKESSKVTLEEGEEPEVLGALKYANNVVDVFLMEFYSGMPDKEIAWGKLRDDDWKVLLEIGRAILRLRFRPTVARVTAKPMTDYLANVFKNNTRKLTLLIGHDSTIHSVLTNLKVRPYVLPNQYENTPIGGNVVFQKRKENGAYFLKIEYVYPTFDQLRNGSKLSLNNPPNSKVLELTECKINENGLCPWEDFIRILNADLDNKKARLRFRIPILNWLKQVVG